MSGGPTSGGQGQLDPRCQEASQRSSRHSPVGPSRATLVGARFAVVFFLVQTCLQDLACGHLGAVRPTTIALIWLMVFWCEV